MEKIENNREPSGGFMIARSYDKIIAAMSDVDAGRILKGMVYEFWGCGEKAAVSDNPLIDALYNSILQTAREIDDNYQTQREQKREAGKRSAETRKRKPASVPTELNNVQECCNGVEQRCNGVELNKSKSKVNKSKENKTKESKESKESKETEQPAALLTPSATTPPSAALTAQKRKFLIDKYGQSAVEAYEQRYDKWRSSKPVCNANADSCISKWMEEDKLPPKGKVSAVSSLDVEMVERAVTERYRQLLDSC